MSITVTMHFPDACYDIAADENQRIIDVINVLSNAQMIRCDNTVFSFCKSLQGEKLVSVYNTFKSSGIYDGDILRIL